MIVLKFGGTSVADAERLRQVAAIVRDRVAQRPIVVVSALAGVTDLLEAAIADALRGDPAAVEPKVAEIERCHRWAVAGTLDDAGERHRVSLELDRAFEDLRGHLRSIRILGEGPARVLDRVLACGERCSSRLIAAALSEAGVPAFWVDAGDVLRTDGCHGAATADLDATSAAVQQRLLTRMEDGSVPVLGGFVGAGPDGATTTLGRGGSDTSAAVLGRCVAADEIQIWTDVDGMLTADPRLVPSARPLPELAFDEALELARFGAKVLHPASVAPAREAGIPIRVLNSWSPEHPGTRLVARRADAGGAPLASLATLRETTWVTFPIAARGVSAIEAWQSGLAAAASVGREALCAVGGPSAYSVALRGRLDPSEERRLRETCGTGVEIEPELGLLSIVGSGLQEGAVRADVLAALGRAAPRAILGGETPYRLTALVPAEDLPPLVQDLHERFFATAAIRGATTPGEVSS